MGERSMRCVRKNMLSSRLVRTKFTFSNVIRLVVVLGIGHKQKFLCRLKKLSYSWGPGPVFLALHNTCCDLNIRDSYISLHEFG